MTRHIRRLARRHFGIHPPQLEIHSLPVLTAEGLGHERGQRGFVAGRRGRHRVLLIPGLEFIVAVIIGPRFLGRPIGPGVVEIIGHPGLADGFAGDRIGHSAAEESRLTP